MVGVSNGELLVSIEQPKLPKTRVRPKRPAIPAKYTDPNTSGLTATITPDTKELPTFKLK